MVQSNNFKRHLTLRKNVGQHHYDLDAGKDYFLKTPNVKTIKKNISKMSYIRK